MGIIMGGKILPAILALGMALMSGAPEAVLDETTSMPALEAEASLPVSGEIDLSIMSTVMSYEEITRILANPTEFLNMKIKIAGSYYALGQSAADRENYCSMYDGCCTYCDVRFVTQDPNRDPAGYIPENQWVTVTGTFGVIVEGPHPVYGLINAKVSAVNR